MENMVPIITWIVQFACIVDGGCYAINCHKVAYPVSHHHPSQKSRYRHQRAVCHFVAGIQTPTHTMDGRLDADLVVGQARRHTTGSSDLTTPIPSHMTMISAICVILSYGFWGHREYTLSNIGSTRFLSPQAKVQCSSLHLYPHDNY